MEHSWRTRPPPGNFCPVCSYSHFPFCPPPPLPQYYAPPPPPPSQPHPDQFSQYSVPHQPPPPVYHPPPPQSSYDPFVDPYQPAPAPPPPPVQTPPRPWHSGPSFNNDFHVRPGLDYSDSGQIKRARYETEDERRLKLIRDHGAASHGLERSYNGEYRFHANNVVEARNGGEGNGHVKRKYEESQFAYQTLENSRHLEVTRSVYDKESGKFVQHHGSSNFSSGHKDESQRSNFPIERRELNSHLSMSKQGIMEPKTTYFGSPSPNINNVHSQGLFNSQPPLPRTPPPPLPVERPGFHFTERVPLSSSSPLPSPYTTFSQANILTTIQYSSKANSKPSDYHAKEFLAIQKTSSSTYVGESEEFLKRHLTSDKPKVVDASLILKHPHRSSRPDHIVVILRGLPGSGKSYLAKLLRDLEVENGGNAPRIHSMDDYFMTEVEKVEDSEGPKSSGSARGKKPVMKKVMEYFYEPEMEEAYRSSMLKAFKKTLDEGVFSFVIVDDRNLRVADFAQFWATAKRSGYEVYLLEATYKDPAGCAARNVHGFSLNDIQKMANQWEEIPSLYMMLDIKSILHGDDLEENGIQEVDMDTEDGSHISAADYTDAEKVATPAKGDLSANGPKNEHKLDALGEHRVELVKELGKSKWSNDLDEDDIENTDVSKRKPSSSDTVKSRSKKGKSLRWADQGGKVGFSIGAGRTSNVSLVIGPGSGYNLMSNPLPEEEKLSVRSSEFKKRNVFQEQLRAERESFRAVFDKRRHRISGLEADEE